VVRAVAVVVEVEGAADADRVWLEPIGLPPASPGRRPRARLFRLQSAASRGENDDVSHRVPIERAAA